jgi:hypothetical protein
MCYLGMAAVWLGVRNSNTSWNKFFNPNEPIIKKVKHIFSNKQSFDSHRKVWVLSGTPCVPYTKVIESEIAVLMPTLNVTHGSRIEFDKCRRLAEIVQLINTLQIRYTGIKRISSIEEWVKNEITYKSDKRYLAMEIKQLATSAGAMGFMSILDNAQRQSKTDRLKFSGEKMTFDGMVSEIVSYNGIQVSYSLCSWTSSLILLI